MNLPFAPWLAVFETLRVDQGRPRHVEEHWLSFQKASKAVGLSITEDLRPRAADLPPQTGRWRWIVNREGTTEFFQPEQTDLVPQYTLSLAEQRLGSANWDALYKTLSYLTHWQARREVRTDEALLLNERGEIACGAMSNIFWVTDGKVKTPRHTCGCREGVVRGWVMKQLRVFQGVYFPEELDVADEIFITNSWIGVTPVVQWNQRKLEIGPVAKELKENFNAEMALPNPGRV
jgi:4-amino-4-deoxychorismate lyase